MKIIELYKNIANGEEIPKKIKFEDKYYIFEERYGKYYRFGETNESIEDDYYISKILNENVEIIEDTEEDKRIEDRARFQYSEIPSWLDINGVITMVNNNFEKHQKALNEIIERLNGDNK